MIQYIYFVKCPNCEDEHFDFFDEAKGFALGCLSKKPIITQTEVCRNDFGECTDSSDLGTVWSWEDECKDCQEPVEEPATFTKDDVAADYDPETDPEFADDDSDFRFVNDMTEALNGGDLDEFKKLCDEIGIVTLGDLDNFKKETGATDANLIDKLKEYRAELGNDFKIRESADDKKLRTWVCWYDNLEIGTVEAYTKEEAEEKMLDEFGAEYFFDSWDHDFSVDPVEDLEECNKRKSISENATKNGGFRTDGYRTAHASYDSDDFDINVEFGMQDEDEYEVEDEVYLLQPGQTVADLVVYLSYKCGYTSIYVYGEADATSNDMKTAYKFETVPGDHDYRDYGTIDSRLVEKCTKKDRKPVPEGMTIEQLVEEMEENEDEVECTWCNDLFPKDMCRKEVNLGWLCSRCADGIMSRGESLTFKENNYWDFLDEKFDIDFEDEASTDSLDYESGLFMDFPDVSDYVEEDEEV
jgi:hypothetical protein